MLRVVIAEDEPAAARYLKSLVETQDSDFSVVAVAGHGEEALELVRQHQPDLVLTDVRMPVLDGIGLAARLKQEFPGTPTVIVSGHQEFEYARQALALGVVDYLLKPVDPAALVKVLVGLKGRLQSRGDSATLEAIMALLAGGRPSTNLPQRFLGALVRWGGPVTRPSPAATAPGGSSPAPGTWLLPGRDAGEFLVLADADSLSRDQFEARTRGLERPQDLQTVTVLFTERAVPAAELADTIRDLGPMLDRLLVTGKVRIHWGPVRESPVVTLDPVWAQRVRLALQESAYHKLETLVRGLVAEWEREERPVRQAATLLRQVLLLAQQDGPGGGRIPARLGIPV